MKDFNFYAPTEVVFGEQSEEQVGALVKKHGGTKVLVHYGGQSAVRSGLLDKICGLLEQDGLPYVKLGGVVPNPRLSLAKQGIELCHKENIDFILAVGGGSVIDSSKCIGYGACYDGDVWDFYIGKASPTATLPVAAVLTIPAAGSEMSEASVITNEDGDVKLGYSNNISRPKFAIMNPCRTFTLPSYQTAAGVTDIMLHTMERYFNTECDMTLTDAIAETLMRTMKECVFAVLKNPEDYRNRAQIMWGGSLAHNDVTGYRNNGDWATHQLEHELSGMFDVTHGAGLAAVWGSWARYVYKNCLPRFKKFAINVMDVADEGTDEEIALRGIEAMEDFYRSINMPTNLRELGVNATEEDLVLMAKKCAIGVGGEKGSAKVLDEAAMLEIYRASM